MAYAKTRLRRVRGFQQTTQRGFVFQEIMKTDLREIVAYRSVLIHSKLRFRDILNICFACYHMSDRTVRKVPIMKCCYQNLITIF